ncbi:MAG: MiaB/RimO family radical SAM methylthiotransferase [Ruminococcus sp.]|jgi:threonylcarbamoyladenosine tRNA methylthiotransferase MtaB|nr:MiaB/RimO family radical SAM methylthiotransferase [Ruminococcus sp.]
MMKIINFGCKVAKYDTTCLPDFGEGSVVISSCTVTNNAFNKVKDCVEKCVKENPDKKIILTGCIPDSYLPPQNVEIYDIKSKKPNPQPQSTTRAYLKIQDGCENFCSYCIIPFTRGKEVSKPPSEVLAEAEMLSEFHKEIVLCGINLGKHKNLKEIVTRISEIDNIKRIRLSSLEPDEFVFIKNEKLMPYFHISLQSGSDTVLKRMNRKYDTLFFKNLIEKIKSTYENPFIATDVIVGFPGETDEEFESTKKFVRELNIAKTNVFPFSAMLGTVAYDMPEQVDEFVKKKRCKDLRDISNDLLKQFYISQIGKTRSVLFEGHKGYTDNYVPVRSNEYKKNIIEEVKITEENIIK